MAAPLATLLAVAGGYFGRRSPAWGAALLAASALCLGLAVVAPPWRAAGLLALVALAAAGWGAAAPRAATCLPLDRPLRLRGLVAEDPTRTEDGFRLFVDLQALAPPGGGPWSPAAGRVLLRVEGVPLPRPGRGDATLVSATLRRPRGLRNPGNAGYEAYLARKGVDARTSAEWPGEVAFAAPGPGAPGWLRWRRAEVRAMTAAVPGQAGAVLAAMTLGDWSGVSTETSDAFRRAGTTHLVAISGMHLAILALILLPPVRSALARVPGLALATPVEPLARLAVLPALGAYAALSGFQTSTLRALAMASLVLAALGLSRPTAALAVLSAAAALIAVAWPEALGDPGFQLSVAALAGLFWLAPRLEERIAGPSRAADPLARLASRAERLGRSAGRGALRLACAAVAASAATAPVSAFHFGAASPWGLLANPVAVPVAEFLCLPVALAGTALHALWPGGGVALWRLAGVGLEGLLRLQRLIPEDAPMLASPLLGEPLGLAGALGLVAALGLALDRGVPLRRAALAAGAAAAALLLPAAARRGREALDPAAHLWALDVGQGQALALRLPGRRWVLVDAGGFPGSAVDAGEQVVVPALEALGASRLWLAVSSHPHPDHVLGLASVVRRTRPRTLWLPAAFAGDERYGPALEAARAAGSRVEWIGAEGRRIASGGARLEAAAGRGPEENDRSLVLRLRCGGRTALLPGDLEAGGQEALLASGFSPRCDVLLAPHHGSRSALCEAFLRAARPAAVLVSASGRRGLPSAEFLAAAGSLPARVLTTSDEGCLHTALGPGAVRVEAAVPGGRVRGE